jgi:hypothetical protein
LLPEHATDTPGLAYACIVADPEVTRFWSYFLFAGIPA